MKVSKFLLLFSLDCLWSLTLLQAQNSSSKNLSFELGNFTNWTGYTWKYSRTLPSINTDEVEGIVSRKQTIMSDTAAYDANTGFALKKIPSGYKYSARLGDEINQSDTRPRCWNQSLRYTMSVDSSNALLILKYALVLQYIRNHPEINQPRFRLMLYDSQGDTLPDCANYDVYSSDECSRGFANHTPEGATVPVMWRDWTTVGVNLLKYLGQTITIEFMSADCAQQYHYGYAYFVAESQPLYITRNYCTDGAVAKLTAPAGFEKYNWTNSSGTTLDTLQNLTVTAQDPKSSYTCTMTSATGCIVSLHTSIVKYLPKADFSSFMIDCNSNTVQLTNLSTTTYGTLSYRWIFGDGNSSDLKDPTYTFSTSGMHRMTLILSNLPSACKDTITKDIESFSPLLVGINGDSTFCPGLSTWLEAYGASDFIWSNGSTANSIEIAAPGGTFWLVGRSNTGCTSDTIFKTLTEEPDWEFLTHADTTICGMRSVILSASGADSYLWDNGTTNDSVSVSSPGKYIVRVANNRGCMKSAIFNVMQYPLPAVDFSVLPDALDSRHNKLTCIIPAEPGVQYAWNMGDGSSETGPRVQHEYSISNNSQQYTVTLNASTEYGCTDTSFIIVNVFPFIPNVFTPDGDGINEVFMEGFELEIVDRHGLKIYKGNAGWDGRYNGELADPDTYFYLIFFNDNKQIIQARKGYVTLVR